MRWKLKSTVSLAHNQSQKSPPQLHPERALPTPAPRFTAQMASEASGPAAGHDALIAQGRGLDGQGPQRRTRPVLRGGGAPRPAHRAHTAHPHWGNAPLPRGGDPARPLPSGASRRLGCPRRTGRRDLRGPGSARGWRVPPRPREVGKGKCRSRTGGYSQEWPGALRPPPASPPGEASKAAAASEQQLSCRRRSLEPPGVAGTGGDFTTSLLGDFSFAAAPDQWQSPRNWGRANETRSPSSLHAPAQGLAGNCSSPRCSSALAPPPSSKAPPPGCRALGREAGQLGSGWGEFRPDREPGTGAEFLADRPGPGRAGLLLPAARAGSGPRVLALPRGGPGSHGAQAPHRWPPEKESWP